ncbi:peptide ABC transporter ATP-binding protein [Jeotgalicoccus coquinae]|uniref:Putative hemin import ATP-binding protein HrtA n=1 Tax=Jeotgalicoccus coquinae TaxID=709509 RepID=A0A6V7R2M2_9STAP|nr:ABC transporter ATP-binding protein [Jeotgalicoccus coquinae]MBB6423510.1 putative ABC transport system ATP-binding protein [Jeotgalicoccus coquinae]GGE20385.1 peptide ABC transporter ATP-binding protein [Jeotgalicoccus coquinae]CAD2071560.1 Bacitracin export ATP-binding protein BceA [Jeotgalicoccus coquinae]
MSLFQLEDIKKEFKHGSTKEQILKGINLELKRGELTALVGASGSGKSTLLTIAAGLQDLSSGSITFGGQNMSAMNAEGIREIRAKYFGFVFQHAHLVPFLTVREQLELMLDTAETKWSKKSRAARIEDALKTVDMWNHKDSYPESLSGGEKQRVAIARAIIHEPEILFADEPTASLDSKRSIEVMELIEKLARELNITVLMVTHDNDMLEYAERIVEMKDGKIIES